MATKNGTNAALIAALPNGNRVNQGVNGGKIHCLYDEYVFSADLALNDIIVMGGMIPGGARVIDVLIDSPDLDTQSAGTLDFGWAASADGVEVADDDGFVESMDVHTAGKAQALSGQLATTYAGKFKKFSSPVQPQIVISGETDATSGTIRTAIYYILD